MGLTVNWGQLGKDLIDPEDNVAKPAFNNFAHPAERWAQMGHEYWLPGGHLNSQTIVKGAGIVGAAGLALAGGATALGAGAAEAGGGLAGEAGGGAGLLGRLGSASKVFNIGHAISNLAHPGGGSGGQNPNLNPEQFQPDHASGLGAYRW